MKAASFFKSVGVAKRSLRKHAADSLARFVICEMPNGFDVRHKDHLKGDEKNRARRSKPLTHHRAYGRLGEQQ